MGVVSSVDEHLACKVVAVLQATKKKKLEYCLLNLSGHTVKTKHRLINALKCCSKDKNAQEGCLGDRQGAQ